MNQFVGKVVLITGAGSGIGRATAIAFAENGARVVVSDVNEAGGNKTVAHIKDQSGEAIFVQTDVTQADQVANLIETTINQYSRLDVAVNNAGIGGVRARTANYPEDVWQQVIDVNLTGVWTCMKYELPQMLKQGGGSIVNLASVAGLVGFPGHAAYAATKHAVIGLTKTAALEYVRKRIRVNAVCPAFTETPMVEEMMETTPAFEEKLVSAIPARRLGKPEEIAAAILYLCSEQAGFITGHALTLDGGLVAG